MPSEEQTLEVRGVDKRYGGVHALRNVNWSVRAGEVHGLVGENGAGKSTLIKMISGAETPDRGAVLIHGQPIVLGDTQSALAAGVSPVYQEPELFADLSVAENIFLGREETRMGRVDWTSQQKTVERLLSRLKLDPEIMHSRVGDLPVGEQQLVSIAKAFAVDVRLLILDEPSAILTNTEIERLFDIIRGLRDEGIGVIYISHRLDELGRITDRITVMRDGSVIGTYATEEMSPAKIAQAMVGDKFEIADRSDRRSAATDDVVLEVSSLAQGKRLDNVSLQLHRGEIVGVYGLIGSGTTELARVLFGVTPPDGGDIRVKGELVRIRSPRSAMRLGLAMLPGNRKLQGVFQPKSLAFNVSASHLPFFSRLGIFDDRHERRTTGDLIRRLGIKAPGPSTPVGALSGGNQQKVVMGRQLVEVPDILLAEEPTQGVDVGAKSEIHQLILDHAAEGHSAIVFSTDLDEIRFLADRILVMRHGEISAELNGDVSAVTLLSAASGELESEGAR
ncbi:MULTISPECIES: sugar ABC transporter ATP-binding protein [unclassified Actinomyces]|uniref:sugar ABC transporter ATP-binding protein n=1 Tax=unclassified Actinomyces TaxID=2609248 RepID=UPI000D590696|nr:MULTISPECIES: sugar ABC transporter ATP-binding protein [unclassified Actinomyces]RAX24345.1 sugar ABC transporter ATP-binding protein [Actinomyces sp. Z3]